MKRLLSLSWRSLWRNKRRTAISVGSIGSGLALCVFFVSLRNGVYSRLVEEAVRMQGGHVTLEHPEYREAPSVDLLIHDAGDIRRRIEALPGVERTKAVVMGQALIKSGNGSVGVMVTGVEPAAERNSSPLSHRVTAGSYLEGNDGAEVLIGRHLAERLNVGPGKKAVLAVSTVGGEMAEELVRVRGVFAVGVPQVDGYMVQAPIGFARRLFGIAPDQCTQLGIVLDNPDKEGRIVRAVAPMVAGRPIAVRGWQEIMPNVASFIRIGEVSNVIYQGLFMFLILLTIFNTLLMSVLERRREFAVLLALGTPPRDLRLQVLMETALLGVLGCGIGLLAGSAGAYYAQVHGIDMRHVFREGVNLSGFAFDLIFRPRPTPAIVIWAGGLVFGATLLLGLYPMSLAARVRAAEWLR